MKYLKAVRNVHLWLGLFMAILLLVEAITGLILSEPWLIGTTVGSDNRGVAVDANSSATPRANNVHQEKLRQEFGTVSILVFIKQLHQGIIYSKNFRWVVDIVAISIIVLTVTGIYLAIPILRAKLNNKSG